MFEDLEFKTGEKLSKNDVERLHKKMIITRKFSAAPVEELDKIYEMEKS